MIPFCPVPYLFIVGIVASQNPGLGLVPIATLAALGAAIGKFTIYAVGYGKSRVLSGKRSRFNALRKLLGGSAFLAAFIFAASPFPDDIIFIPLGIMRYSPTKTFISLFSGKFVLTLLVAYLARSSSSFLDILLGGSPIATAVSVGVVVVIAIVMMRVDWEKVLARRHDGIIRRTFRRIKNTFRKPKAPATGSADSGTKPDVPPAPS